MGVLLQRVEAVPDPDVQSVPVIEACTLESPIVERETERTDEVEARPCGEAQPPDISRIWRDFRLVKDDVEHADGQVEKIAEKKTPSAGGCPAAGGAGDLLC